MEKVFVIQAMGVKPASLIRTFQGPGKRHRVHIRGNLRSQLVEPRLTFGDEESARAAWKSARLRQRELSAGGRELTVVDAYLAMAPAAPAASE